MVVVLLSIVLGLAGGQQSPEAGIAPSIATLGSFDFDTRTQASRALRRAPSAAVVPALEAAARSHADEYVRFRSFVLLSGLDSTAMTRAATDLLADRNDRVRAVAYQWFERHPAPAVLPRLMSALPSETSEFVRPALLGALAAAAPSDPAVQQVLRPLVLRGDDHFRGSLIAALGRHNGTFAQEELRAVVALDGPLQDDAITAIGRIGPPSARAIIGDLQPRVSRDLQPTVSAALCLLGVDCAARVRFVADTLAFAAASEQQLPLLRGAVHAAGLLAGEHAEVFDAMLAAALATTGARQEAITLGLGTVILEQPLLALRTYESAPQPATVAALFRDSFDMLAEDFNEEQFGAQLRRAFWEAPDGSTRRQAAASLLDALEF